ncbi:hypothetical protein GLP21_12355 [Photobacterium carnosum]|uniref:Uncharacterized protein n=2 Tax=Photobacterium carnosum TaxID=2023717 RepID=A0A2N4UW46_9GAMM|nr:MULTISPECIES: hypothetical protein [Photobacterium]MCD9475858.1 hypothetical protein [Photobacterium phosphoreum]MCD9507720.1 hypothetical protein [Photobacterium phosphoreum]MCD9542554.1 hypothetical protein [Photobacterium carnosum]MCD9545940.1 hypothetical protein [Photobacterium carnosum]MCD9549421.1 hypothetical protein [Photobacterium carnosum]
MLTIADNCEIKILYYNNHPPTYKQKIYAMRIYNDLNLMIPVDDILTSLETAQDFIKKHSPFHTVYRRLTNIVKAEFKDELCEVELVEYGEYIDCHRNLSITEVMEHLRINKTEYLDSIAAHKAYIFKLAQSNSMSDFDNYQLEDLESWKQFKTIHFFYDLLRLNLNYTINDAIKQYVWQYAIYINGTINFNNHRIFMNNLLLSENLTAIYGDS